MFDDLQLLADVARSPLSVGDGHTWGLLGRAGPGSFSDLPLSQVHVPQCDKQKDLKGSKAISVLFLVELMRLDMQMLSEKHVKVVSRLLTLASQLA